MWRLFGDLIHASLTIGLALLESVKFLAPVKQDAINFAFGIFSGSNTTLDDQVLESATNERLWEENLYVMLSLKRITVANECFTSIDGDGLSNLDRHV